MARFGETLGGCDDGCGKREERLDLDLGRSLDEWHVGHSVGEDGMFLRLSMGC